MPDIYVPMDFQMVRAVDQLAIKLHATRSDLIKYCVQEMLPELQSLSVEDRQKLARAFDKFEAVKKPEPDRSEF